MSLAGITKYFNQNSKERDLSGNWNQEEAAKKLKEGSLNTSRASDIPDEMLTESLKSPDCVNILLSCIKTVEKQITKVVEIRRKCRKDSLKAKSNLQN